jgi:hypothetical protein
MKELVHTWQSQPYSVETARPRAPTAPRTTMDEKVCSNGFSRQAAKWLIRQIPEDKSNIVPETLAKEFASGYRNRSFKDLKMDR